MLHAHCLLCVPQTRPPRGRKTTLEEAPRIATIHEYLDWTVTAEDALGDNELVRCPCLSPFLSLPPSHPPFAASYLATWCCTIRHLSLCWRHVQPRL